MPTKSSSTVVLRALQRALLVNLAAFAFVGGAALWGLWEEGRSLESLALGAMPRTFAIERMLDGISTFQVGLLRFMGYMDRDLKLSRRGLESLEAGTKALAMGGDLEVQAVARETSTLHRELERLEKLNQSVEVFEELDVQFRSLNGQAQSVADRVRRLDERLRGQGAQTSASSIRFAGRVRAYVLAGVGFGLVAGVGTLVFLLRRLRDPFRDLLTFLGAAAERDLTGTLAPAGDDELGALARAAARLKDTLVATLRSLGAVAEEVSARGGALQSSAERARDSAEEQLVRCGAGAMKSREVATELEPVVWLSGKLREEAEQAATSVQQILAMTEQVQSEMAGLCVRVEATSDSVRDLDEATGRVAAVTSQLGSAAQSVAASAEAIDRASEALRSGAGEGRALTEAVAGRAGDGRASMAETLDGMVRIREAVDTAVARFERLGADLARVERVTQVIDDIAGRTNLLSLNAAIIAAQAGEHGRAFGVVASEIRSLAEKTAASTREIRAIVDSVGEGGKEASEAISEGAERVQRGEELVRKTGLLLEAIHGSADSAARRLRALDDVAIGQASETARVADEIRQVTQGVVDIVAEIRDEQERTREIRVALADMADVARHTVRAADEQSRGTNFITKSVTAVSQAAEQVEKAIGAVGRLLSGLRLDLEALDARAREDLEVVARVAVEGEALAALADGIGREAGTFRLPEAR